MMNRLLGVILIGIGLQAQAQQPAPARKTMFPSNERWGALGVRAQAQDFYVSEANVLDTCNCQPQTWKTRGNAGWNLSYYRNTGTRLAYSLDLGFSTGRVGTKPVPTLLAIKQRFTSFRGDVYYNMGASNQLVTPYLHTGLHAQLGSFYASVPTGFGFRFTAPKRPIMLTGEINYGWGISDELRNSLIVGVGMYIKLKGNKPVRDNGGDWGGAATQEIKETATSACTDSDFDGVADGSDKCPKLPGSPLNAGCPSCDTDKDGVVDDKDECPTVAGPIESRGCPVRIIRDTVHIAAPANSSASTAEFPTIYFTPGTVQLDSNAVGLTTQLATMIKNRPADRFTVVGYSKLSKPEQKVSLDQVMSVINYLVEKEGIRPERLIPKAGQQGQDPNRVKARVAESWE